MKENSYYSKIKEKGIEVHREEVEQKKIECILKKAESHSMPVMARLEGTLKKNFVDQVVRQGYKESELCREIFKFYYDNHPRFNNNSY